MLEIRNASGRFLISLVIAVFAIASCSLNPEVKKKKFLDKGVAYFDKGQYREANIEFENAIQIDPKFADAHYRLAQSLMKQGDWSHAYQELTRTVEFDPANQKAQLDLGNILLAGRQFQQAHDRAQTILQSDPNNPQAQLLLANADAALGNDAKALDEAHAALKMDPGRSQSYLNVAVIQEKNKDLAAAEGSFKKAISLDPKSTSALMALGAFYERQKRWVDAGKQFQAAITLDPKNPAPRATLAGLYLNEGQRDMAEQTLRDAKSALQGDPKGYRMLGEFYVATNQPEKALAEFASLYSEHPKDADRRKHLHSAVDLHKSRRRSHQSQRRHAENRFVGSKRSSFSRRVADSAGKVRGIRFTFSKKPPKMPRMMPVRTISSALHMLRMRILVTLKLNGSTPCTCVELVEALRALAALAMRRGDAATLSQVSQQMIQVQPQSPEGYVYHAQALLRQNNAVGAEADLKKAIEVAPAILALTRAWVTFACFRSAMTRLKNFTPTRCNAILPPLMRSPVWSILIWCETARQSARRVQDQIAKVPNSSQLYSLLGQIELKNQQKDRPNFSKAVDLDNNNVPAFLPCSRAPRSRARSIRQSPDTNAPSKPILAMFVFIFPSRAFFKPAAIGNRRKISYKKALAVQPDYPSPQTNLSYLLLEHGGDAQRRSLSRPDRPQGLPDLPAPPTPSAGRQSGRLLLGDRYAERSRANSR